MLARGVGAFTVDGVMADGPFIDRARAVLRIARVGRSACLRRTNEAAQAKLRAGAEMRVAELFDIIDTEVAKNARPWRLGEGYSVRDAYAFILCRWPRRNDIQTRQMKDGMRPSCRC
jgi:glutathione S-transferase